MQSQLEQLFLRTISDLGNKISSNDPYEILGASALIRKLFLDDYKLFDQVNREYKIKLIFHVCLPIPDPPGSPKPFLFSIQDGLDPDTALRPGRLVSQLTRDSFFKVVVLIIGSKEYTIKDVILFEANVMGGVHVGTPKSEKEKILKMIDSQLSVGGYATSLRQLQAIGRVILKAITPLKVAIENK